MSLGLCRLSKTAETNALAVSAQEHMNRALMPSGPLNLWMSKEEGAPLTAFWLNLTLSIELWPRGMFDGVVPRSSKVEFEVKKTPRRSDFPVAVWTKVSFLVRNGGSGAKAG